MKQISGVGRFTIEYDDTGRATITITTTPEPNGYHTIVRATSTEWTAEAVYPDELLDQP